MNINNYGHMTNAIMGMILDVWVSGAQQVSMDSRFLLNSVITDAIIFLFTSTRYLFFFFDFEIYPAP